MADMEPETENGAMLSQADLDALVAAAGQTVEDYDESYSSEEGAGFLSVDDAGAEEPSGRTPRTGGAGTGGLVDLPSFAPASPASPLPLEGAAGLGRVRDIPLEVTVELGRTRLLIRDIMDLAAGSIIELDKIAGEPVDLFANGMLVARGEVIVIDDNFGVRVTEIITAQDRTSAREDHARAA